MKAYLKPFFCENSLVVRYCCIGVHRSGSLNLLDGFRENEIFAKSCIVLVLFVCGPGSATMWLQTGYLDGFGKLWEDSGVHLASGI